MHLHLCHHVLRRYFQCQTQVKCLSKHWIECIEGFFWESIYAFQSHFVRWINQRNFYFQIIGLMMYTQKLVFIALWKPYIVYFNLRILSGKRLIKLYFVREIEKRNPLWNLNIVKQPPKSTCMLPLDASSCD